MNEWKPATEAPEGILVDTKISDANGVRNKTRLVRKGNLWWTEDMKMYVYYWPTHWRKIF